MYKVTGKVLAEPNEIYKGEGFALMPNPNGRRKRVEFYGGESVEVEHRRYGGGFAKPKDEAAEVEPVAQTENRDCVECGREFLAHHPDARYCQQACHRRRTNRHKREKREARFASQDAA